MKRISLVLLVAVLVMVMSATVVSAQGPVGPNPDNGHYYEVVTSPYNYFPWDEAKTAAEAREFNGCKGHLATITSQKENDYIRDSLPQAITYGAWLGGIQAPGSPEPPYDGGWSWITGEPWVYTNWRATTGEPNGAEEDALHFWLGTQYWNDLFNDNRTNFSRAYLIEYSCKSVVIDIKPGSDPNCFNSDGHGVIPVAILTTDTFDASTVDPFTVSLDGATARVKGKSGKAGSLEDVDGDGDLDLVLQIEDQEGTYSQGDTVATLTGQTYSDEDIVGSDSICIVP